MLRLNHPFSLQTITRIDPKRSWIQSLWPFDILWPYCLIYLDLPTFHHCLSGFDLPSFDSLAIGLDRLARGLKHLMTYYSMFTSFVLGFFMDRNWRTCLCQKKGWTSATNFPDARSAFEGGWHGWDRVDRKRYTRSTMKGPIISWFGWTGAIVNEELFDHLIFWGFLEFITSLLLIAAIFTLFYIQYSFIQLILIRYLWEVPSSRCNWYYCICVVFCICRIFCFIFHVACACSKGIFESVGQWEGFAVWYSEEFDGGDHQ